MVHQNSLKIFHHIPKTAGTAFRAALGQWFNLLNDYITIEELQGQVPVHAPIDITALSPEHCLCGHYEIDKNSLFTRYPAILEFPSHFSVFTILRDPLQLQISMFYFAKKTKIFGNIDLELDDFIMLQKNYIAQRFQCSLANYKKVLDRYCFIGLQEDLQGSLDVLSNLLGKQRLRLEIVNASGRADNANNLARTTVDKFMEHNYLDYKIYEYGKKRYSLDKGRF